MEITKWNCSIGLPPPKLGPTHLGLSAHDGENRGALSALPLVASLVASGRSMDMAGGQFGTNEDEGFTNDGGWW
jgi:hypothetical protein